MSNEPRPSSTPAPSSRTPHKVPRSKQGFYGNPQSGSKNGPRSDPTNGPKPNSNSLQQLPRVPINQYQFKALMRTELSGATWEMKPVDLARALSTKSRKPEAPLVSGDVRDTIDNYDLHLHDDGDLQKAVQELERLVQAHQITFPPKDSPHNSERQHYQPLAQFLQCCLDAALTIADKAVEPFYSKLSFTALKGHVVDAIGDVGTLEPDLAGYIPRTTVESRDGVHSRVTPKRFSWILPDSARLDHTHCELLIPIEVKGQSWKESVVQAATYSRGLFYAAPLRQFSLALAYLYGTKHLRFLIYHSGGLTASTALNIDDDNDRMEILRLFSAILTWKTRGDAGLPEWCDNTACYLPLQDDGSGTEFVITEVLQRTLAVRGRCPEVWRLSIRDGASDSRPSAAKIPVAVTQGASASNKRKALDAADLERKRKKHELPLARTQGDVFTTASDAGAENATTDELAVARSETAAQRMEDNQHATIIPLKEDKIRFVPQCISDLPNDKKSFAENFDIVSKCSWVSGQYFDAEKNLFGACGDEFGVAKHYYSSVVHHKENLPATNHLFMEFAAFWKVVDNGSESPREYRVLRQHVSSFAGRSLVMAKTPQELFTAIGHAILGYWNMLCKDFQHRDISIGNVLLSRNAQTKNSLLEKVQDLLSAEGDLVRDRSETLEKIRLLLSILGIDKDCKGFVIDGDLSIKLSDYSFVSDNTTSRSGTAEFMSVALNNAAELGARYLQSPIDDLWSFFFVAIWAAVWHIVEGPVSPTLQKLRKELSRSTNDRGGVVTGITGFVRLRVGEYGPFLPLCQKFFTEWNLKLGQLEAKWDDFVFDKQDDHDVIKKQFVVYYEQGVADYLELLNTYYPAETV